jgi:hypothetical protein
MAKLAPNRACEDVSTFVEVVLLSSCRGGFNNGQPRSSAKFMEDLVMADLTLRPSL